MKKNTATAQVRTARRTERALAAVNQKTLFIEGLNGEERDVLRGRVFYSGASDTYIASYGSQLALAVSEFLKLRGRRKATVRMRGNDFILTAKAKRRKQER